MSKGNPIVPIRMSPGLIAQIDSLIASANKLRRGAPYDRSSWITAAIKEKIAHRERSKKVKKLPPAETLSPSPEKILPMDQTQPPENS